MGFQVVYEYIDCLPFCPSFVFPLPSICFFLAHTHHFLGGSRKAESTHVGRKVSFNILRRCFVIFVHCIVQRARSSLYHLMLSFLTSFSPIVRPDMCTFRRLEEERNRLEMEKRVCQPSLFLRAAVIPPLPFLFCSSFVRISLFLENSDVTSFLPISILNFFSFHSSQHSVKPLLCQQNDLPNDFTVPQCPLQQKVRLISYELSWPAATFPIGTHFLVF